MSTFSNAFRELSLVPRARLVGVYLLLLDGDIVYVGSSTDVETRIEQHAIGADAARVERKKFDRVIWLPLPAKVLGAYEGALIRALWPRYNYRAPRDRGHDAEILEGLGVAPRIAVAPTRFKPQPAQGDVCARIRAARERAGLTATKLARALGVCRQTIFHWENGVRAPSMASLGKLASALGVPATELWTGGDA